MKKNFEVEEKGSISKALGIVVSIDKENSEINLDNVLAIEEIAGKYLDPDIKKSTWTPIQEAVNWPEKEPKIDKTIRYQNLVGELMHLMVTVRPDITFAVGSLARFLSCYGREHFEIATRVARYLAETKGMELTYKRGETEEIKLEAYVDANYETKEDCHSRTGYVLMLNGAAIDWASKKQSVVALSSAEAEYIAVSQCCQSVLFYRGLLEEIGFPQQTTLIHEDNKSTIHIAENLELSQRTKHIHVKYHHVRELVKQKTIKLEYVSTDKNIADIFTKGLGRTKFNQFRNGLGLRMKPIDGVKLTHLAMKNVEDCLGIRLAVTASGSVGYRIYGAETASEKQSKPNTYGDQSQGKGA